MGRQLKRVPKGFAWPLRKIWFGYVLDSIPCQLCNGHKGKRAQGPTHVRYGDGEGYIFKTKYCECCEGEGEVYPTVEVPRGDAYQMWEDCTEGSPISPTFDTPEELARWLADNKASAFGDLTATYEQWLQMIHDGYVASAVVSSQGMQSGVEAAAGLSANT
jgi:hypothetical protein